MGQGNSSEAELARAGDAMTQNVSIPPLAEARRSNKHRRKPAQGNGGGLSDTHTQAAAGVRRRSSFRALRHHDELPPAVSGNDGTVLPPPTLKRAGDSNLGKSYGSLCHMPNCTSPQHLTRDTVQAVAASAWSSSPSTQSPALGLQRASSRRDVAYNGEYNTTLGNPASRPAAQPPARLQPLPSVASPSAHAGPLLSPSAQQQQQVQLQSLSHRPPPSSGLARLAAVPHSARDDGPLAWRPTTPPGLAARRVVSQPNMTVGFDTGADSGHFAMLQPFQSPAPPMQTALLMPDTTTIVGSDEARRERESVSTATTGLTRRRSSVTINMNASVVLDSDAEEGTYDTSAGLRYTPSAPLQNPANASPKSILKKVSSFRATGNGGASMSSTGAAAGPVQLALRNARRQGELEAAENNEGQAAQYSSRQHHPRRRSSDERAGGVEIVGEGRDAVLQLHPEPELDGVDFAAAAAARPFAGRHFGKPLSLLPITMQAGEREKSISMPEPRQLSVAPTLQKSWQRSPMLVLYEIPLRGRHGGGRGAATGSSTGGVDDADYPVETYGDDCTLIKVKTAAGGSGVSFKVDELIAHRKASVAIEAKLLHRACKLFVAGYTASVLALDHGGLVNRHAAPLESPSCLAVQKLVLDVVAEVRRLQELMRVVSPCDYDLYLHPTTDQTSSSNNNNNNNMSSAAVARVTGSSSSSNNNMVSEEQASRTTSSHLGVAGARDVTLRLVCSLALVRRASSEEGARTPLEAMYTATEESSFECVDLFDTTTPAAGQPLKLHSSVLHGSYLTRLTYHPVTDASQFTSLLVDAQARAAEYVSREFADNTSAGSEADESSGGTSGLYFYVLTCLLTRQHGSLATLTFDKVSHNALSATLASQADSDLALESDEDDLLSTPVAVRRQLSASLAAPAGAAGPETDDLVVSSLTCVMAEDRLGVYDAALECDQMRVPTAFFDGVLGAPCESHVVLGLDPRDATSSAALEMQSRVATKLHRHGRYGSVRQFLGEAAVIAGTHTPRAHATGTGEADATSWKEKQLRKLQEVREVERLVRHVQTHGGCEVTK